MKICFIPIDNRPVCYTLAQQICAMDSAIELFIPPREMLGDLKRISDIDGILYWMENLPETDSMILSLDTIAYGGLIPSRRGKESYDEVKARLERLKPLLCGKKVYAFSSIMRISNNNYNEEEKEYWSEYGKKIFEYSFNGGGETDVPEEIIEDYLGTRRRNFEVNKLYLEWQQEGLFDTLIFSKDDCAEKGFNVDEARELERLGGKTKTGADEIPLSLLARSIEKDIKVFVEYSEPEYKDRISNYEDVSVEKSVLGQLELCGYKTVENAEDADLILYVNNFVEKQGEHVMGWDTLDNWDERDFTPPAKPYAIADVRYANGADNKFVEKILPKLDDNFYGYAGWNTSANTLGSLLAGVKVRGKCRKWCKDAFKQLQMVRFLDDWAYQANIRVNGKTPDIKEMMKPFEDRLSKVFGYIETTSIKYIYPWNRSFEIEVSL